MPTSLSLLCALALPAAAQEQPSPAPELPDGPAAEDAPSPDAEEGSAGDGGFAVLLGLTASGRLPMGELSPGFVPALEAGVRLPVAGGRLGAVATFSASWGSADGAGTDERMPDGSYQWTMRERELVGGLLLIGRAFDPGDRSWSPELVVGPQLHRQVMLGDGSAGGGSFGEYREVRTRVGVTAAVGVAATLGPGELLGRVGLSGASVNGTLSGQESGTLGPFIGVGYRLVL